MQKLKTGHYRDVSRHAAIYGHTIQAQFVWDDVFLIDETRIYQLFSCLDARLGRLLWTRSFHSERVPPTCPYAAQLPYSRSFWVCPRSLSRHPIGFTSLGFGPRGHASPTVELVQPIDFHRPGYLYLPSNAGGGIVFRILSSRTTGVTLCAVHMFVRPKMSLGPVDKLVFIRWPEPHLRFLLERNSCGRPAVSMADGNRRSKTILWFLTALTVVLLVFRFSWSPIQGGPESGTPLNLALAFNLIAFYVKQLFLVEGSRCLYTYLDVHTWGLETWVTCSLVVALGFWTCHDGLNSVVIGFLWFFVFIGPVPFYSFGTLAADRYLYLPILNCGSIAAVVDALIGQTVHMARVVVAVFLVLLALGALSGAESRVAR